MADINPSFFASILIHLESILRHGGYTVLFMVSLLEGFPIIGQFIPGHTIVIFSGFLTKISVLNIKIVLPLVVLGAMIGDIIGYLIGKKFGFVFLNKYGKYFFITEAHIEKAKKLIKDHVGKTIILGRFSPITRQLTPYIVGASDIHIKSFWIYDLLGVLIWSATSIGIGYMFGASYHIVAGIFGKFIVVAIIISIILIWAYKFINKEFHLFAKYELITLGLNISSLYIFFKTLQDATSNSSYMSELDIWFNVFINERTTTWGLYFMNLVDNFFNINTLIICTLICTTYLIFKKKWRYTFITIISIGLGPILNGFLKELIMRDRPINSVILETGYSFPSGHAMAVTVFFTLLIYFFIGNVKNILYRESLILLSVLIILTISFSRLYLGVHWLTDIIAGISFGLFWTTFTILSVRYIGMIVSRIFKSNKN